MTSLGIAPSIRTLMAEVLRLAPDKITPELTIHKIDTWNSLTHIELIVSIEERFNIQLTEDEITAMTSVAEIERILNGRGVT